MNLSMIMLVDIRSGQQFCNYKLPGEESQRTNSSKEALTQLLSLVEKNFQARNSVFDELFKLMSRLDLMVDFSEFTQFYDFVFFMCRENGQKNINISRAITAWKLVLAGRFRLLNRWCDFIEKNQRHNISEDTWQQVLAFSRKDMTLKVHGLSLLMTLSSICTAFYDRISKLACLVATVVMQNLNHVSMKILFQETSIFARFTFGSV